MANKKSPGLPQGFKLNIPDPEPEPTAGPVQMGDYLDEVDSAPPKAKPPQPEQKRTTDTNVVDFPKPAKEAQEPGGSKPKAEDRTPPAPDDQKKKKKKTKGPARKQINATPEALKMIEELLYHVQTYSVQNDAKASE